MKMDSKKVGIGIIGLIVLIIVGIFLFGGNKEVYKVTFVNDDSKEVVEVKKNDAVSRPDDPTKTVYVFKGWYNGTTEFDFTSKITEDITLTAQWEKVADKVDDSDKNYYNMLFNIFGSYSWLVILAELVVVIGLSARIRKMKPTTAKLLFCAYSFLTGLTFSSIFVIYEISSIIYVFGITALLFLIFALIGYFTKIDLTKIGVYLFMILLGVIICSIINIFVGSKTFDLGITIVCLIVFIIYIAYDMQIIKRNLYLISEEDNLAIYGALQLYLDFINIFLRLLQLFGRSRD